MESSRCTGVVVVWRDDKKYGFAENLDARDERIFLHVSNTLNRTLLQVGDVVSFVAGESLSHPGKTCAKQIRLEKRLTAQTASAVSTSAVKS
jgi:cold shock CspA family protein